MFIKLQNFVLFLSPVETFKQVKKCYSVFPWKYFFFSNCNYSACIFLQKRTIFQHIHPGSHMHCMSSSLCMLTLHQIVSSSLKHFFQLTLGARVFVDYYVVLQGQVFFCCFFFFSNSGSFNL